jgi:branched-chain amino acid transport system ATP-binding protein
MTQAALQPTRPQDLGPIQLAVNNIEVVYHDIVQVLRGVSLEIPKGKIVALLGTNGAGKTTTLKAISGLLKPENGSIRDGQVSLEGNRIDTLSAEGIVRKGIVQVPEGRRVFKHLTVEENLRVGSITGKGNAKDDLARMYSYFPRLEQMRNRQAGYCSGGEQQMLAISRALMAHPQMLLLDEPSLGIAPLLVKEIFERVKHINLEMGVTVMVVEQNANVALAHADYGYIMESGRIVLEGTASELKDNPDVREFYLGVTEGGGRKSYRDVKSYKRRKRWM